MPIISLLRIIAVIKAFPYIYITDITREGLDNPDLVAGDNLHPSQLAYSKFVDRLIPIALDKLFLESCNSE